jgi:uncharacterized integral membrane protein
MTHGQVVAETEAPEASTPPQAGGWRINEDWAATVVGLILVVLVLVGIIGKGIIP